MQDIRFTVRQLRKNPGFGCTAIGVLAMGVCANISILAFVEGALLKPLPDRDSSRLVDVTESITVMPHAALSYLDYRDWQRLNNVFSSLEAYAGGGFLLESRYGTELVESLRVSNGFFRTLGVEAACGRGFRKGDDQPGAPSLVLLTYSAWQKRFGGRRNVVGKTIRLSGVPYLVIGVLPREFQFSPAGKAEFYTMLDGASPCEKRRSCHNLQAIGRLKNDATVQAALANMTAIAQQRR